MMICVMIRVIKMTQIGQGVVTEAVLIVIDRVIPFTLHVFLVVVVVVVVVVVAAAAVGAAVLVIAVVVAVAAAAVVVYLKYSLNEL